MSVLSDGLHGCVKGMEQTALRVENPVVEADCDVERCISSACHLPGEETWDLALEVDV